MRGQVLGPLCTGVSVLNSSDVPGDATSATSYKGATVGEQMKVTVLELRSTFLKEDSGRIDYAAIRESELFRFRLLAIARQLLEVDMGAMSVGERKSFLINVYNSLVMHGLAHTAGTHSAWQYLGDTVSRLQFYASIGYNIGGNIYSLNDIEHGLLRANAASPAPMAMKQFSSSDPRLAFALPSVDPRIHFTLNCGATSCPPVAHYSSNIDKLERQLNLSTRSFFANADNFKVDESAHIIHLSMILYWYRPDFGADEAEMLKWISEYVPEETKPALLSHDHPKYQVQYVPYNWALA